MSARAGSAPGALTQLNPAELRADLVVSLTDGVQPILAIIVEAQRSSWQPIKVALLAQPVLLHQRRRDLSVLYFDLIDAALSEAARKAFQMLPQGYEFQSETLRKNIATTKAADILDFLDARGLSVSPEQRERILGCTDLDMLKRWIRRAATITSVDALFE